MFWSCFAAVFCVLNPLDLIPDFIPLVGRVYDAAVIAAWVKRSVTRVSSNDLLDDFGTIGTIPAFVFQSDL